MRPTQAVLIRAAGRAEDVTVSSLEDLQRAVGGFIEAVDFGPEATALCNEDGKYLCLPPNGLATLLARRLGVQFLPGDSLCGDCLILGKADARGEDTDCPAGVRDLIHEAARVADPAYTPTLGEALRNPDAFVEAMEEI